VRRVPCPLSFLVGRLLAAQTPQRREEAVFEIVNQLNRGAYRRTGRAPPAGRPQPGRQSAVARTQDREFLGVSFTAGPDVKRTIAPKALDRWRHAEGDHMVDYKQVTRDIREELAKITKEGKSIELIMKEILAVLTKICERHKLDKFEFIQAFYKWYKERRR
jgi:hypothetical protein